MVIAGAYLNAPMSSIVVYMYFEPALATMLCELMLEHKKYIMKDVRMVVRHFMDVLGQLSFGIGVSKTLWRSQGLRLTQRKGASLTMMSGTISVR